jgi:hypothetical protein
MTPFCGFAYVQARAQARVGQLLGEQQWLHLAAARGLSAYLEEARTTALRPWVMGFSSASDSHDIERGIRAQFRTTVVEAVGWVQRDWRPAVHWVAWLTELPLLQLLLGGKRVPWWVARDRHLSGYLDRSGQVSRAGIEQAGGSVLIAAWERGEPLDAAWLSHWQTLLPRRHRQTTRSLEQLTELLVRHGRDFRALQPAQTRAARRELRERLQHLFHLWPLQPAALFSYLGLVACDLERLRGALVRRVLFSAEASL